MDTGNAPATPGARTERDAYEVAERLARSGRAVDLVAMLDTDPADAGFVTRTGQRISLLQRTIWVAYRKYRPTPSRLPVLLLRTAESQMAAADVSLGWSPFLQGDFESAVVPGSHFTMFDEPHVHVVAQRIASALAPAACEPQ